MKEKNLIDKKYFSSFDYLRVFFAMAVVAWHTRALGVTTLMTNQLNLNLKELIYGNIFLIAVPIFVQISLFLYLYNRDIKENYFKKRIFRLGSIYVFWLSAVVVLMLGIGQVNFRSPIFWVSGGGSQVYFIFTVIIMTILLEFFFRIKKFFSPNGFLYFSLVMLTISTVIILFKANLLSYINLDPKYLQLFIPYWNPINFIPYIFSSFIFFYFYQRGYLQKKDVRVEIWITLILIILLAYLEYRFMSRYEIFLNYDAVIVPPYNRLSIILSTWLILYVFLNRNYQSPVFIKKLSGLTLGVFLIHLFLMNIFAAQLPFIYNSVKNSFVYFAIIITASFIVSYFIKDQEII